MAQITLQKRKQDNNNNKTECIGVDNGVSVSE